MLRTPALRASRVAHHARPLVAAFSTGGKLKSPPMVYIKGEEMTHHCMNLVMEHWIEPHVDVSAWETFDLSCKQRDDTEDQCLRDAVAAGARIGAIFKEPTITPTSEQKAEMGLKRSFGSPNGAMRAGWNGITISRDTIHIDGLELGFKNPVLFERHAVGGEYGAGWKELGPGFLTTVFTPADGGAAEVVDSRTLKDERNAVVSYHNPLDNVEDLAHYFFERCLEANVTPYVVTKKTVFKWQESFWTIAEGVFNEHYIDAFNAKDLLGKEQKLQHLISDAATMQIIRWTDGNFGMMAHNYDGDMLTDEVAQVHRSPGFMTSNLVGKNAEGGLIKEFEASHGTVSDMWHAHLRGEETSMNPLGMVEALVSAMKHAAEIAPEGKDQALWQFADDVRSHMHAAMADGNGTRDLMGPAGLTTEQFVENIAARINSTQAGNPMARSKTQIAAADTESDQELMRKLFDDLDLDGNGSIDFQEFAKGMKKLGVSPKL